MVLIKVSGLTLGDLFFICICDSSLIRFPLNLKGRGVCWDLIEEIDVSGVVFATGWYENDEEGSDRAKFKGIPADENEVGVAFILK